MNWKRLLAYITGSVDQELLLRNEYLATENRLLRKQLKGRPRLTDDERITLAEIGQRLGRKALAEVAQIVRPETILAWHRKLVAQKFDGAKNRSTPGRLCMANCYSCCDWQFEEPVAMRLPSIIVEAGWRHGCLGVGHFSRRVTI